MSENLPHRTPSTAAVQTTPWEGDLPRELAARFPGSGLAFHTYLGQNYAELPPGRVELFPLLQHLRDHHAFDMLTDLTAVDRGGDDRDTRFSVVYILYSFGANQYVRLKAFATPVSGNAADFFAPSVVTLWPAANWLEREVFDMFGIRFEGHPSLKRILMPDDWTGHPLRKDYSILGTDEDWVRSNLEIRNVEAG